MMLISVSQMDTQMKSFLNSALQAAIMMLISVSRMASQMGGLLNSEV